MKFSESSISNVNIDNSVTFMKLACLKIEFPKIGFFGIWVCNLQTRQVMSKFFSDFVPPH